MRLPAIASPCLAEWPTKPCIGDPDEPAAPQAKCTEWAPEASTLPEEELFLHELVDFLRLPPVLRKERVDPRQLLQAAARYGRHCSGIATTL
jgi:hypothetical protein